MKQLLLFLVLVGYCFAGFTYGSPPVDAGFVFTRDKDLNDSDRARSVGPLFETQSSIQGQEFTALRPFFSRISDADKDRDLSEYLWPLGVSKRTGSDLYRRFLIAYDHNYDTSDLNSKYQASLFPLLFYGIDSLGNHYRALFPIGGHINDFITMDKIAFYMFPLYARTEKGSFVAHNILWPFIMWGHGDNVSRLRIFPFYAKSDNKSKATVSKFILWPFWTSVSFKDGNPDDGVFIFFPFFGAGHRADARVHYLLPPFFKWAKGARGDMAINCPWPFYQYSRGRVDKLYLWPLWGQRSISTTKRSFFLWPIGHTYKSLEPSAEKSGFSLVPLVYIDKKTQTKGENAGEVFSRNVKLWPICSYERENDVSRFRLLDLWPVRKAGSIERNLAPLWTLYSHERAGSVRDDELLWGLFRYRRGGDERKLSLFPLFSVKKDENKDVKTKEYSLLMGLFGYKKEGLHKTYRLLYFLKFHKDED